MNRGESYKNISDIDMDHYETMNNIIPHQMPNYSYIFIVVALLFYIYMLNWLNNIDKCSCSHIPEGRYLKEWFVFMIIVDIVWLFLVIAFGLNNIYVQTLAGFLIITSVITFIFIVRTVLYIRKLKKNKCLCGSRFQRESIYDVLLIYLSIVSILLIILLVLFIMSFFI